MSNTVVILNPAAGNEEAKYWQGRVESISRGCLIHTTSHPGGAEALARQAVEQGFGKIVAAGGDDVSLTRDQTLMQGAPRCTFRYRFAPRS